MCVGPLAQPGHALFNSQPSVSSVPSAGARRETRGCCNHEGELFAPPQLLRSSLCEVHSQPRIQWSLLLHTCGVLLPLAALSSLGAHPACSLPRDSLQSVWSNISEGGSVARQTQVCTYVNYLFSLSSIYFFLICKIKLKSPTLPAVMMIKLWFSTLAAHQNSLGSPKMPVPGLHPDP